MFILVFKMKHMTFVFRTRTMSLLTDQSIYEEQNDKNYGYHLQSIKLKEYIIYNSKNHFWFSFILFMLLNSIMVPTVCKA